MRSNFPQQFVFQEWLGQIIVYSASNHVVAVHLHDARGQRDDLCLLSGGILPDSMRGLEVVHDGHAHVHQDQRRSPFLPNSECRFPVFGLPYRRADHREELVEAATVIWLIINNEHIWSFL